MSAAVISLLFGLGVAGWVWSKVGRRTGQADAKTVWLTAAGAGVAAFIVFFTLLHSMLGIG